MAERVSAELSKAVFDDALVAHDDPNHPCHAFVGVQVGVDPGRWQLPVPFMGSEANLGLVFLGLNPNWRADEDSPRWGCTFEEYDRFWRQVFEAPPATWPKLYQWYQRIGQRSAPGFVLGRDALVLEAIRYRSATPDALKDPRVWRHERPLTLRLLTDVAPKVIVPVGKDALWYLGDMLPALASVLPSPLRLDAVELRRFSVAAPWGEVNVVPSRHLTGAWPMTDEDRLKLAEPIRLALL